MSNMIKTYDEFVNEGLISDYKKQKEQEEKEISASDKKFVLGILKTFDEIKMPFTFVCKNCAIIGISVRGSYTSKNIDRDTQYNIKDIEERGNDYAHITEKSIMKLFDEGEDDNKWNSNDDYKNIWKNIYKWFEKEYEKKGLTFEGKVSVGRILDMKEDIKKDLL